MHKLFNSSNGLWITVSAIGDVLGLSLVWFFCCIPIVTIGPASAALYRGINDHTRHMIPGAFKTYFRVFKENLKQGIVATIPVLMISAVCFASLWFSSYAVMQKINGAFLIFTAGCIITAYLLGWMCYLFPTMSRFQYSLKDLFKTTLMLSIAHLPSTILLVCIVVLCVIAVWYIWCLFIFVPALAALLGSFILERLYKKHAE